MAKQILSALVRGSRVSIQFEGRQFDVIVIDPNGLGEGQPSIGLGYNMMEKYGGLNGSTLSDWTTTESGFQGDRNNAPKLLKVPSGNTYRVTEIPSHGINDYFVLEVSDWVAVAADVLKSSGKVKKPTLHKLIDFLSWFAAKGLYAEAYTAFKGIYTDCDSRATSKWLEARNAGKVARKAYTDLLKSLGCRDAEYAQWTDYIYQGLFGMRAKAMIAKWDKQEGSASIARNRIQKIAGLSAVEFCEDMVARLYIDNLEEAHATAVGLAKRKYQEIV